MMLNMIILFILANIGFAYKNNLWYGKKSKSSNYRLVKRQNPSVMFVDKHLH